MTDVLIAGAGPTGLLLAAELERRDVDTLLIDAHDAPLGWDRATVVHPRSAEIFEAMGVVDRLLEVGVQGRRVRFRAGGETLGEMDLGELDSRYGFDIGISEQVTEEILTASLEAHGGAVTRATRLMDLRPGSDGVTATIESDGERSDVDVSWVVGCDGFHSTVRKLAGIDFPGKDIEAPWSVFDAGVDGWEEEFDLTFPFLDEPTVILTPLPGRRFRVYMHPAPEEGDLVSEAAAVVNRYVPQASFADVENQARFRCHCRVAAHYRVDRLLLAGDAAHVCSPAEGHGMNTGLQDAFNLGWKLALVCRGESGSDILDSYEAERRPVAERVGASGDAAEAAQGLSSPEERAERDAGMRRTFADPEATHHEAVAHAELDRSYAASPLVAGDENDRLTPGARLPDTDPVEPAGGEPRALHELTHREGHTLLVLGAPGADVSPLTTTLEDSHSNHPAVDAVIGVRLGASVADQLGVEGITVLAVRPDRYVGLRHDGTNPDAVRAYLETLSA